MQNGSKFREWLYGGRTAVCRVREGARGPDNSHSYCFVASREKENTTVPEKRLIIFSKLKPSHFLDTRYLSRQRRRRRPSPTSAGRHTAVLSAERVATEDRTADAHGWLLGLEHAKLR